MPKSRTLSWLAGPEGLRSNPLGPNPNQEGPVLLPKSKRPKPPKRPIVPEFDPKNQIFEYFGGRSLAFCSIFGPFFPFVFISHFLKFFSFYQNSRRFPVACCLTNSSRDYKKMKKLFARFFHFFIFLHVILIFDEYRNIWTQRKQKSFNRSIICF